MSTRATYQFLHDGESCTVYKHHDGYPKGAGRWIANALRLAWPLPRFEPDEFAAAFIAANKTEAGGVRVTTGREAHGDIEWHYIVSVHDGALWVQAYTVFNSEHGNQLITRKFSGPLERFHAEYPPLAA